MSSESGSINPVGFSLWVTAPEGGGAVPSGNIMIIYESHILGGEVGFMNSHIGWGGLVTGSALVGEIPLGIQLAVAQGHSYLYAHISYVMNDPLSLYKGRQYHKLRLTSFEWRRINLRWRIWYRSEVVDVGVLYFITRKKQTISQTQPLIRTPLKGHGDVQSSGRRLKLPRGIPKVTFHHLPRQTWSTS